MGNIRGDVDPNVHWNGRKERIPGVSYLMCNVTHFIVHTLIIQNLI